MIARTNLILSKVEPVCQAETVRLEEMIVESIQILHSSAEKKTALEEIKSCLEKMAAFNWEKHNP